MTTTQETSVKYFEVLTEPEYYNNLYKVFLNILVKAKKAAQTE